MRLPTLSSFALLAASLSAQTTHLVGPNGLPQIRDALAIAATGDTIVVEPGSYAHFTATVGVTIRAVNPGTVFVAYDPAFATPGCLGDPFCALFEGPTWLLPPVGETVHVIGITFEPNFVVAAETVHHRVGAGGGTVTFDQCALGSNMTHALAVFEVAVHLQDSSIVNLQGNGSSLFGIDADITATGCLFEGGSGPASLFHDSIELQGCTFVGTDLTIQSGSSPASGPGAAITATDSAVWIADSIVTAPATQCPVVAVSCTGRIDRSTLTPTVTSTGFVCSTGPTLPSGPVVGVTRPSPPRNGSAFQMYVRTEPLTLVAVHASNALDTNTVPGLFEQPISLGLQDHWLAGVFLSDANGNVLAAWNLPASQYVGTPIWLQAIAFVPSLPIQVGPIVGGVIR